MTGKFILDQQPGQLHGPARTQLVTVSGGPTLLPGDPLAGRKDFLLYNPGPDVVFLGGDDVTPSTGIPVSATASFSAQLGRAGIYATVSGTNQPVRIMEVA
jgi:hypothetical protein